MFKNRNFGGMCCNMNRDCGCKMQPIVEPAINKCIEREFCHEVPHD